MTRIATPKISKDNTIAITPALNFLSEQRGYTVKAGDRIEIHAERENPLSISATIILRAIPQYMEKP